VSKYLVSGKDDRDRSVTEVVSAPNTDEAVRRFKARGFTDVVLHSDEVIGHLFKPEVLEHFSPRDHLALGRVSRSEFAWRLILKLYRSQWWLFAIIIVFVAGRRILETPWELIDTLATAFFFMPPVVVLLNELFSPARKYERAMTFNAWGRWTEMLTALKGVRFAVPAPQYAFHEAKALAGLGRIDDALEVVRPFGDDPKTPAWLYWGQLSDVFNAAKMPDRVIECGEKALENAPHNVTVLIDLAMAVLRFRRDATRARPLLERAREHEISDLILPFLTAAEGVLALEEKKPEQARRLLEEALNLVEPFRHASPLMGSATDRIHVYLALACAATGDHHAAEQNYRIAEPRLLAFNATDLIDRCRTVIGNL
jgi:tetratricopeptide (TPR) repeat protein